MTHPSLAGLRRLIYISSASGGGDQAELDAILATSRKNNSACGITGVLLFHDGCFFQVLEGDAEPVGRTFANIANDTRHGGVIVLEACNVSERGFPNWSMGYVGAHALRPAQRDWLVDLSTRIASDDPSPLTDVARISVHIEAFLSSFREFA